jgi:hypothetical protein
MQQLCHDYALSLGVRKRGENDVEAVAPVDWGTFFEKVASRTQPGAFEKLLKGPDPRGTSRTPRRFNVVDITTDIYGAVLYGMVKVGLNKAIRYQEIVQVLEKSFDKPPRSGEVTNALRHMSEIAFKSRGASDPALDFKNGVVHIMDPFLAFTSNTAPGLSSHSHLGLRSAPASREKPGHRPAATVAIISVVAESPPAPTLAKLEAEVSAAVNEHHDEIVHQVAVALVQIVVEERASKNGDAPPRGPRLCVVCKTRLAADARRECHSCTGRRRRARERLRAAHAAEVAAAANGMRGVRAAELATGARIDPAAPFIAPRRLADMPTSATRAATIEKRH